MNAGEPVQFIALDCWNGSVTQANSFVSSTGITYPLLRTAQSTSNLYAGGYDYVYVVGADGIVNYRNLNAWVTSQVEDAVDQALADIATNAPIPTAGSSQLLAPWPNPFNPRTSLTVDVAAASDRLTLDVLDVRGRAVRSLLRDELVFNGRREFVWDGKNDSGARVQSGVYYFRLRGDSGVDVRKGVLVQ